jgi:hypothetical protein
VAVGNTSEANLKRQTTKMEVNDEKRECEIFCGYFVADCNDLTSEYLHQIWIAFVGSLDVPAIDSNYNTFHNEPSCMTKSMLYKLIDAQKPVIEDGIKAVNRRLEFIVLVLPHITSNHLKPLLREF